MTQKGVCVWLTGLSGAGKSTTARHLAERLSGLGRTVTVLDGDELRARQWPHLGFSRRDRSLQVMRVAKLARDVVRIEQVAVCALISPYRDMRARARQLIGTSDFVEVFVDAPLQLCEARDTKGLYQRARLGTLTGLTGIDEPYEKPLFPEVVLTSNGPTVQDNVNELIEYLSQRGLI